MPKKLLRSMYAYAIRVARQRIDTMLRYNLRDPIKPTVGDKVYLWRDQDG